MGWYIESTLPPDYEWKGFATREYLRASEGPFSLNLTADEFTLPPDQIQRAELDWTTDPEPLNLWTIEDEDTFSDEWYLESEPQEFYWPLLSDVEYFYTVEVPTAFYWQVSGDPAVFYPTIETDPDPDWYSIYSAPARRFYIINQPVTSFYWAIVEEPA